MNTDQIYQAYCDQLVEIQELTEKLKKWEACADIYEKIIKGEWTTDMFVYFCRELYKEGEEAASNEACL